MPQPKACSSSSRREFALRAAAGQGASRPEMQMLLPNVFAPTVAMFLISKPLVAVWSMATCKGGLPTITFPRIVLP